ncbi:MAG: hypothetical protein HKO92_06150 [Flavobacteriaceae bacterium]|nr:HmuY family protein [Bacteroidia bacterium]NNK82684.1 hypothetical protein [Flavobacteriaceae bacterium]
MKTIKLFTLLVIFIGFTSCSDDDNDPVVLEIESDTISNLYAPQDGGFGEPVSGDFTKFDFSTGATTTSTTDWDIAFRGTSIIVNGGMSSGATDEPERTGNAAAYFENSTLAGVASVNTTLLEQDSVNGAVLSDWYTYSGPPTHSINPTAGKIIVLRTRDGKYAKMEILSYYQDGQPNAEYNNYRYYTFNYVYQPNSGTTIFE